jgi:micrococcal nuclease
MEAPVFTKPVYIYRVVKVVKVVDGDTIDVLLDVGFHTYLQKRLRFLKIDTWEVRGEEREQGLLAKDRLIELLDESDAVYVQTVMDARGKYGRVLAWLWTEKDSAMTNINDQLLIEGHAQLYGK